MRKSPKLVPPIWGGLAHLRKVRASLPPSSAQTNASFPNSPSIEATFRVGRYTCHARFQLPAKPGSLQLEWSPCVPPPKTLTAEELNQYRAGRDALMEEVVRLTGLRILMVGS